MTKGRSKPKTRNKSYKKKGHAIDDCYRFQNKNKAAVNHKGNQPVNSGQVNVVEDDHNDRELLTVSNGDSMPSKEWVLDSSWHVSCVPIETGFQHMILC